MRTQRMAPGRGATFGALVAALLALGYLGVHTGNAQAAGGSEPPGVARVGAAPAPVPGPAAGRPGARPHHLPDGDAASVHTLVLAHRGGRERAADGRDHGHRPLGGTRRRRSPGLAPRTRGELQPGRAAPHRDRQPAGTHLRHLRRGQHTPRGAGGHPRLRGPRTDRRERRPDREVPRGRRTGPPLDSGRPRDDGPPGSTGLRRPDHRQTADSPALRRRAAPRWGGTRMIASRWPPTTLRPPDYVAGIHRDAIVGAERATDARTQGWRAGSRAKGSSLTALSA